MRIVIEIKKKRTHSVPKNVIKHNVTGVILEQDNTYVVFLDDVFYRIHPTNFKTLGVRKVYAKDELGRWFIYDRVIAEERRQMPSAYIPFKPKFECIGDVVLDNGVEYFKIKKSYNPHDINSKTQAVKEIEKEDESCDE